MEQDELLARFEKEFEALKKKLKFKTSLEELDDKFYIRDFVLRLGHVPHRLSRMVSKTVLEALSGWGNYLHSLIIPHPHSLPGVTESRLFTDEEKEEFKKLISQVMMLSSKNSINGLKNDPAADGRFIDESTRFWNKQLKPKLIEVMEKAHKKWDEEQKTIPVK